MDKNERSIIVPESKNVTGKKLLDNIIPERMQLTITKEINGDSQFVILYGEKYPVISTRVEKITVYRKSRLSIAQLKTLFQLKSGKNPNDTENKAVFAEFIKPYQAGFKAKIGKKLVPKTIFVISNSDYFKLAKMFFPVIEQVESDL